MEEIDSSINATKVRKLEEIELKEKKWKFVRGGRGFLTQRTEEKSHILDTQKN